MKKIFLVLCLIIFMSPVFAASFVSTEGDISVTAEVLQMSANVIKAKNKIYLNTVSDKSDKISIQCNQMTIKTNTQGLKNINDLSECEFSGNVIFKYVANNNKGKISCLAFAKSAYYDNKTKKLVLTGNVKIDYINEKGAKVSAKGKKAVVDMSKNPKPDDVLFSIEGEDNFDAKIIGDSNILDDYFEE